MTDLIIPIMEDIVLWALLSAGLWKMLEKCGKPGWPALIPGYRYYKLAECTGNERDGVVILICEVIIRIMGFPMDFLPDDSNTAFILYILSLTAMIIAMVARLRIINRLCYIFAVSRWWLLLWAFIPIVPAIIWGFGKKYVPVRLGSNPDNSILAGTNPAAISAPFDKDEQDDGLTIHLRSRTVRDFTKKRYLLKDINLTIPRNSLVLLLGGSGSGKTTLVNAVIGYEKADAYINLNGKDVYKDYDEMKYHIGFVPQQELLRDYDTVIRTLSDAAALRLPVQMKEDDVNKRIDDVMDVLGLKAGKDGLVSKKSGGQKKRISIGVELISDPDLFVLDEPDSGLDGVLARELFERLRDIAHQDNVVIAITHTPDRVADLFDKVIVLARDSGKVGRLAFYGSLPEAREFFGKDTMEQIVMAINEKDAGGEGRADEFIEKFAEYTSRGGKEAV